MRSRWPRRADPTTGEAGQVLPLVGLMLFVIVAFTALGIDLGSLALERRNLQKATDLAAIDATEPLEHGHPYDAMLRAEVQDAAEAGALRNGYQVGSDGTAVETWIGQYSYTDPAGFTRCDDLIPPDDPDLCEYNAVEIQITGRAPRYFAFWADRFTVTTRAVAALEDLAGVSMGSFVARGRTTDSEVYNAALGDMLGPGPLGVDAAGYDGLARARISYEDLAAELGFATPEEMSEGSFEYSDMARATYRILERDPETDEDTKAAALEICKAAEESDGSAGTEDCQGQSQPSPDPIQGEDVFEIGTGRDGAGSDATVSALDLLMGGARTSTQRNALDFFVGANLPEGIGCARVVGGSGGAVAHSRVLPGRPVEHGGILFRAFRTAQSAFVFELSTDPCEEATSGGMLNADFSLLIEVGSAQAHLRVLYCPADEVNADAIAEVRGDATRYGLVAGRFFDGPDDVPEEADDLITLVASAINGQDIVSAQELAAYGPEDGLYTWFAPTPEGWSSRRKFRTYPHHRQDFAQLASDLFADPALNDPALTGVVSAIDPSQVDVFLNDVATAFGVRYASVDVGVFGVQCDIPILVE